MNFAPVIIPTLCRYEHFKQCLNSLSECTYAEQTDIYIGLDYPLKEEHWNGYQKILSFLDNFDKNKFKSITIIKRPYNYGLGPKGNIRTLCKEILENYDRFIFTEDDNIFSKNFLEYINKGLDLYEKDKSIFAINGYKHLMEFKYSDNNHFAQNVGFSAWGYGIWKDRYLLFFKKNKMQYYIKALLNPFALYRIYQNGWSRINTLLYIIKKKDIRFADYILNIYLPIEKQNVIMPIISKVRNCGWDGSGENCNPNNQELKDLHSNQKLDINIHFEYKGNPLNYYKENRELIVKNGYSRLSFREFTRLIFKPILKKRKK